MHGELVGLGYRVAASTVWAFLRQTGVDPGDRPPRLSGIGLETVGIAELSVDQG